MRLALSSLAVILLASLPAVAQTAAGEEAAPQAAASDSGAVGTVPAGSYAFDPHHSHIIWSYDHMGWSTSNGIVRGLEGVITLDPANPAATTVEAHFPLSALETVSPELDQDIQGPDFFNGEPENTPISFKSTEVDLTGEKTAKLTGDLTLNGVTKPVVLDVTLVNMGNYPMDDTPAVAFQGEGMIKRSDFNLGAFAPAVSDDVKVTVVIEAQKS